MVGTLLCFVDLSLLIAEGLALTLMGIDSNQLRYCAATYLLYDEMQDCAMGCIQ